MIEVSALQKKFRVADPKKLTDVERQDPRAKGKFFYSVESVSLCCREGEVLGLVGPNGAGKTTTLRLLSTALKPDAGTLMMNGIDVTNQPQQARRQLGFLSGATGLYHRLTGRENMAYFAGLNGLSQAQTSEAIDSLAEQLDLHEFIDRRTSTYSSGMRQRISIARAVINQPKVVILDEPTTGLDIMSTQTILEFVRRLKAAGTVVVFSTHHLEEVEQVCDRVAVINQGRTSFEGGFEQFKALSDESLHQSFLNSL